MFSAVRSFLEILKTFPELKGTEFFNDESDLAWNGNAGIWKESWLNFRNTHYFPGFVCKMVSLYCRIAEDQYGVRLAIVDSDNCHLQWEKFLFSGNRSQFTPLVKYPSTDIIRKPMFNAYHLMSRLGRRRFVSVCGAEGFARKFGMLATLKDSDSAAVMVWNFEDGIDDDVNSRTIEVRLTGLPFKGTYRLLHYRIDREHSSSYTIWKNLGSPASPTTEQIKRIREREGLETMSPPRTLEITGEFTMELFMPMHSVSLLLLLPENHEAPAVPTELQAVFETGNASHPQVFLTWKPNDESDFYYYRIWRKAGRERRFTQLCTRESLNTAVYTDMDIRNGHEYVYRIQSVNATLSESGMSEECRIAT